MNTYPSYIEIDGGFKYTPIKPVWEVDFGVYSQQIARTTATKYSFSIGYNLLNETDRDIILNFLIQERGKEFIFISPHNQQSYTVRLEGDIPTAEWQKFIYYKINTFTLKEV